MFIEVERNIIEDAVKNSTESQLNRSAEVLFQLALAVQRGAHVVLVSSIFDKTYKLLFEQLSKIIGKVYVDLFRGLAERRTFWGAISQHINIKVVITLDKKRKSSETEIIINPNVLSDFHFEQETVVLTENLSDAEFFKHLVLYYKKQHQLKGAKTEYYASNGGGATLHQVLTYEMNLLHHFCIAITDSDKCYPSAKHKEYGTTYKDAFKAHKKYNQYRTCTLYVMKNVSEIENLIPNSILGKHLLCNEKHIYWESKELSFYDIKFGLKAKSLYEQAIYSYWVAIFPEINFADVQKLRSKIKRKDDYCIVVEKNGINDVVPLYWGKDILSTAVKKEKVALENVTIKELTSAQQIEWNAIGENLFTWTCGLKSKI